MYISRAYQSPKAGWHCGPQCAQIPNFASLNQSGTRYAPANDGQSAVMGPAPRATDEVMAALAAALPRNERRSTFNCYRLDKARIRYCLIIRRSAGVDRPMIPRADT